MFSCVCIYIYIIKPIEKALGYKIIIIVKRTAAPFGLLFGVCLLRFFSVSRSSSSSFLPMLLLHVCEWYIMDSKRSFLNTWILWRDFFLLFNVAFPIVLPFQLVHIVFFTSSSFFPSYNFDIGYNFSFFFYFSMKITSLFK